MVSLRREINEAGLEFEAIENFDPAHWHDVLLDGPRKREHLENCKTIVRRLGEAGIPIMGYNFSIAGVCGRVTGRFARGEALSVGMDGAGRHADATRAWPGTWSSIRRRRPERLPSATPEQLWRGSRSFWTKSCRSRKRPGVTLAAHPDDPPMPTMRSQPRLVYQPQLYQRLLDLRPSPANALEFCLGTIAEMADGDVYDATDRLQPAGQTRLRPLPQYHRQGAPLPRNVRRRRRHRHAPHTPHPQEE